MLQTQTRCMHDPSLGLDERVKEVTFDHKLMVTTVFSKVDYRDCFEVRVNAVNSIDAFVRDYFLAQPFWLRTLSLELFSRKKLLESLENNAFNKGDKVGSWKVYGRDEQEIAFGQDMGFMEYVFSFHLERPNLVKVATVVHFNGVLGKYYFKVVKLFHKPFVKLSLKNSLER